MNELLEQIKKQKSCIEVYGSSIMLEQELGDGFGSVIVKTGSHRQNKNFRNNFNYAVSSAYGSYYYIPNKKEAIDEARKLGCTIARHRKPFNNINISNLSDEERKIIMQTVNEKNVKYTFTKDTIDMFLDTIKETIGSNLINVKKDSNIIILGNFHFHFSEYEPVKVISTIDESFQDTLYTFNEVINTIENLSKVIGKF